MASHRLHCDCGNNAVLRFCKMEGLAGYGSRLILPGTQGLKQLAKLVEKKKKIYLLQLMGMQSLGDVFKQTKTTTITTPNSNNNYLPRTLSQQHGIGSQKDTVTV